MFLLPPHRDITVQALETDPSHDLAARFVNRWTAPVRLRGAAATAKPGDAVTLLACAQILERSPGVHARVRAQSRALAAQTHAGPVHVTLDDIAIAGGTTRSSADSQAAASNDALPWNPEVDEALGTLAAGEPVELWLDTDHGLPAALRIAGKTSSPLTLRGAFAERFFSTLKALPPFHRATPGTAPEAWTRYRGTAVRWKNLRDPPPAGPWCGYARLDELELRAACVVLPIINIENEQVFDAHGLSAPLTRLIELRARGITVVAELHVGAPGVGEEAAQRTLGALQTSGAIDWLAGVRPFHLQSQELSRWPSATARPVDARFDLERTTPFDAPGTCPASALEGLARAAAAIWAPAPARVAEALINLPTKREAGDLLRLDDDAAVVEANGPSGPGWYGAQLRTGLVLKLDARVAGPLAALTRASSVGEVFSALPEAQRSKARDALVQRNLLQQVRSDE